MNKIQLTDQPKKHHPCLKRYDVRYMVTKLKCGINEDGVSAEYAEDYLLHLFGGKLTDIANQVRLPVYDFVDILFAKCKGNIDGTNALRRHNQVHRVRKRHT